MESQKRSTVQDYTFHGEQRHPLLATVSLSSGPPQEASCLHTVYNTPHTEVVYVINGPHVALAVRVIICANSSSIKDRASTTVYLWHRAAQWRRSGGAVAAQWRRSGDFVYDLYVGCSDKKPQTPRSAGYVNRQRRYAGRHRLEPLPQPRFRSICLNNSWYLGQRWPQARRL